MSEAETNKVVENARIEFTTDLRFISFLGKEKQDEGSYSFDKKTRQLTVNSRSEKQVFTVKWSGDTLILENPVKEVMQLVRQ